MNIQSYLNHKTKWEFLLWFSFFLIQTITNISIVSIDLADKNLEWWKPILWEGSSTLAIAMLIPVIVTWDNRFSLSLDTVKQNLPAHIIFTIPFCLAHVFLMVSMREIGYLYFYMEYDFGSWTSAIPYEFLKDFRTYFTLLLIIYLYRFITLRIQGEAKVLHESEIRQKDRDIKGKSVEHLLIKKLGKEFLIKIKDVSWFEANGNYVNLHVSGRIYPFRTTMKSLFSTIDNNEFVRIHRSFIVKYSEIKSIEPLESGDARIELTCGKKLPFSRHYRTEFRR